MTNNVTHDRIMQLAMGFWASKTLLSAVEIGVFGAFAEGPLDLTALRLRLGLHERAARDFLDTLVALGLLRRDDDERYSNTAEADRFLEPQHPFKLSHYRGVFWLALATTVGSPCGRSRDSAAKGGNLGRNAER